ncbi:MarR family winged helix-turn-helix transcriptional regulator [Megalodesulfovibrio paquesii]
METKDDLIMSAVRQFQRVATQYARSEELPIRVTDGVEVTTREAHTIEVVGSRKQLSVTELATALGITKSAASQMVSRLCDKGFLEKRQAPHSNKEFQLTLTPLGQQAFDAHARFHGEDKEALMERLRGFSMSQIATLTVLFEALGEVIDKRLSR